MKKTSEKLLSLCDELAQVVSCDVHDPDGAASGTVAHAISVIKSAAKGFEKLQGRFDEANSVAKEFPRFRDRYRELQDDVIRMSEECYWLKNTPTIDELHRLNRAGGPLFVLNLLSALIDCGVYACEKQNSQLTIRRVNRFELIDQAGNIVTTLREIPDPVFAEYHGMCFAPIDR